MFSNAVGSAIPAVAGEIDLLLLDPKTNADVADRARSLRYGEMMVLPGQDDRIDQSTIRRSFSVNLGRNAKLRINVGSDLDWMATMQRGDDQIDIIPSLRERTSASGIVVSLDGAVSPDAGWAARIGPPVPESDGDYVSVAAGEVQLIRIESNRCVIVRG
jgi:hypothetical protein